MKTFPPSDAQYARCRSRGKFPSLKLPRRGDSLCPDAHLLVARTRIPQVELLGITLQNAFQARLLDNCRPYGHFHRRTSQAIGRAFPKFAHAAYRSFVGMKFSKACCRCLQGIKEWGSWLNPCPKIQPRYHQSPQA